MTNNNILKLREAINTCYFNRFHVMKSLKNLSRHHKATGIIEPTRENLGHFKHEFVYESTCLLSPKIRIKCLGKMCREMEQYFTSEEVSKAKNTVCFENNRPNARKFYSIHTTRIESAVWIEIVLQVEKYYA